MNWRKNKVMSTQTGHRLKNVNWGGNRPLKIQKCGCSKYRIFNPSLRSHLKL